MGVGRIKRAGSSGFIFDLYKDGVISSIHTTPVQGRNLRLGKKEGSGESLQGPLEIESGCGGGI